jgi:hypothetical protein
VSYPLFATSTSLSSINFFPSGYATESIDILNAFLGIYFDGYRYRKNRPYSYLK